MTCARQQNKCEKNWIFFAVGRPIEITVPVRIVCIKRAICQKKKKEEEDDERNAHTMKPI